MSEGPVYAGGSTNGADDSIGPSARKRRGPLDDKTLITRRMTTTVRGHLN